MSVWLCVPSKRPSEEIRPTLKLWHDQGYKIALYVDSPDTDMPWQVAEGLANAVLSREVPYIGYAMAVNELIRFVAGNNPDAEWFVTGGDDVLPDPNHTAEEIAAECNKTFMVRGEVRIATRPLPDDLATFGVMQPTGDDFGAEPNNPDPHLRTPYIHRVAGSPWIGREFARRMYQGKGPYWPEYTHMGVDEELQAVAIKYGVFWQRPDLIHFHQHWGRPRQGEKYGQASRMPAFLEKANSGGEWKRYKRIYTEREAAGFPGSEPL